MRTCSKKPLSVSELASAIPGYNTAEALIKLAEEFEAKAKAKACLRPLARR
jgi:hypothetical protein